MEDEPPRDPRDVDDASISEEFPQVAAHGSRRGVVWRAQVADKNSNLIGGLSPPFVLDLRGDRALPLPLLSHRLVDEVVGIEAGVGR